MMQVSFRVKNLKGGEASGAVAHDFRRKVPGYVDRTRTQQNAVLVGGPPDIPSSIRDQGERVRTRTGKRLRKDANLFLAGILTFSRDARGLVNSTPPDAQAMKFAEKFAEENQVKLLYLVRHSDETTTHYHMLFENITSDGESAKNKINPVVLSRWQDRAGEVFSTVGIGRGTKKSERLAAGEPMSAVIHRSVKRLHEDLPAEILREEERLRETASRRVALEGDFREAIRAEATTLPPFPPEEEAEVIAEQSFFGGTKTRTVKVFRSKPVKKFLEAIAPRLAAAKLFEREVVPKEDFREIQAGRDELAKELAETKRKLDESRERISNLERAVERGRKFVSWLKSNFPDVLSRYLSLRVPESVTSDVRESPSVTCHDSGEPEDEDSVAPK